MGTFSDISKQVYIYIYIYISTANIASYSCQTIRLSMHLCVYNLHIIHTCN